MASFLDRIRENVESTVNKVKTALDTDESGNITFGEVLKGVGKAVTGLEEKKIEVTKSVAETTGEIAGAILRAPQRALTSVGLQAAADTLTLTTGKKTKAVYEPKGRFEEFVFGKEPIKGFGVRIEEVEERTKSFLTTRGVEEDTAIGISLAAAPLFVAGMISLDLTPIGGGRTKLSEAAVKIARTSNIDDILKVLDGLFTGKKAAKESLANALIKVDDVAQVERIIKEAVAGKSAMSAARLTAKEINLPKEVTMIARGAKNVDEVVQIVGSEKDRIRLARINLERINTGEDAKNVISEVSEQFRDTIAERARGVISFEQTAKLAKEVGLTAEELIKLPKGTALNVETLTAARQLLVATAEQMADVSKRILNAPTEENIAAFKTAIASQVQIQSAVKAAISESARATGGLRQIIAAPVEATERVRRFLELENNLQRFTGEKSSDQAAVEFAKLIQSIGDNPEELAKIIGEMNKPNWLDKIVEFSVAAKLWTPTTWLVNAISNTFTMGLRPIEKTAAATADLMMNGFTKGKQRERFFKEAFYDFYGMTAALRMGIPDAIKVYINTLSFGQFVRKLEDTGGSVGNFIHAIRTEEGLRRIGKVAEAATTTGGAIGGRTGKVIRTPFRILQATDQFFRVMNQTAEIHSLAYRSAVQEGLKGEARVRRMAELIKAPSDEMLESAQKKAAEYLFQEELSGISRGVENLRAKHPALKFIIPFLRTPINIAGFSFRRSPLGLISKKNWQDMMKGGGPQADAVARIFIGTAIATELTLLVGEGHLIGDAPTDEGERDKFYREGKLPYAIKIGDTWIQYQRLEPIASFFAMAANLVDKIERGKKEEEIYGLASQFVTQLGEHYIDQTFLIGISDAMDAITDPERYGKKYATSLITGNIPSFIPFVARAVDRTIRAPETLAETIQSKIPFLSREIRPRLTAFGEEVERPGGALRETVPIKYSKEKEDKVEDELTRLGVEINFPNEAITRSGHTVSLTADEHHELVKLTGRLTKTILDKMIGTNAWEKMSDEEKEKTITKISDKVRDPIRDQLFIQAETRRLKIKLPDTEAAQEVVSRIVTSDSYSELSDSIRKELIKRVLEKLDLKP